MTPTEFYSIWKQITVEYPYDKCNPLSSFVLIDSLDKVETPNMGKLYTDYLNGHFWSRDWVNGGAKEDTLKVDYGLTAVERIAMQVGELDVSEMEEIDICDKYYLTVIGKTACETCPDDCLRTLPKIEDWAFLTLTRMLVEFSKFKLYQVSGGFIWSTEARLAILSIIPIRVLDEVSNFLTLDGDMRKWGKGYVGIRGAAINIQLCDCRLDDIVFNITPETSVPVSANTKCDDC